MAIREHGVSAVTVGDLLDPSSTTSRFRTISVHTAGSRPQLFSLSTTFVTHAPIRTVPTSRTCWAPSSCTRTATGGAST